MKAIRATQTLLLFAALLFGLTAHAFDDADALRGVSEGKGLFLVDLTRPDKTALYLEIIQGSHAGMKRQGVEPDFVVVYIGPTVKFLTTRPGDELEMEFGAELARIQKAVKGLGELGVKQEVCAIATKVFNIDNDTLPREMKLVGDGFISLIGYQSQGYKLVPIY